MKRIIYVVLICMFAGMYSCKQTDSSNTGNTDNTPAIQKEKSDSLLNEANKLNSPDSGKTKKDSVKAK
jgi:hypothetical protein